MSGIGTVRELTVYALCDMVLCTLFSICACFIYHFLGILSPIKNKILDAIAHVLLFSLYGVTAFCFILGVTYNRSPRWFMSAGFALGVCAYVLLLRNICRKLIKALVRLLSLALRPLAWAARLLGAAFGHLQKRVRMMYNNTVSKRAQRRARRERQDGEDEQQQKREPLRPYTQT